MEFRVKAQSANELMIIDDVTLYSLTSVAQLFSDDLDTTLTNTNGSDVAPSNNGTTGIQESSHISQANETFSTTESKESMATNSTESETVDTNLTVADETGNATSEAGIGFNETSSTNGTIETTTFETTGDSSMFYFGSF
jgi:hypothetical protein